MHSTDGCQLSRPRILWLSLYCTLRPKGCRSLGIAPTPPLSRITEDERRKQVRIGLHGRGVVCFLPPETSIAGAMVTSKCPGPVRNVNTGKSAAPAAAD